MSNIKTYVKSTILTGLGMWIIGGLYHNLLLPSVDKSIHPHHEGLAIVLLAYFLLALVMTYLYIQHKSKTKTLSWSILFGCLVGFLWVFPHGLAMAATHGTSVLYECSNMLYHLVEQGAGGVIIYYVVKPLQKG